MWRAAPGPGHRHPGHHRRRAGRPSGPRHPGGAGGGAARLRGEIPAAAPHVFRGEGGGEKSSTSWPGGPGGGADAPARHHPRPGGGGAGGEKGSSTLRVVCSKGTYVRTLCHDIGQALGCGGCMASLRRTMAAGYTLADAHPLEEVLSAPDPGALLLPVDSCFRHLPELTLTAAQEKRVRNGAAFSFDRRAPGGRTASRGSFWPSAGGRRASCGPSEFFRGVSTWRTIATRQSSPGLFRRGAPGPRGPAEAWWGAGPRSWGLPRRPHLRPPSPGGWWGDRRSPCSTLRRTGPGSWSGTTASAGWRCSPLTGP